MDEVFEKRSKQHPNATWEECLEFIKKIDNKKLPIVAYSEIASEYGLQSYQTRSFMKKLATSKQFRLIEVGNLTIKLTEISKKILYPTTDVQELELECFISPPLYKELVEKYNNKAIPNVNILGNILLSEFGITRAAKDNAAKVFIENAERMGALRGGVLCYPENIANMNASEIEKSENIEEIEENIDNNKIPNEQNVVTKSYELQNNVEDYFKINIPTSVGKTAQVYIPNGLSIEDAELLKDMIDVILKRKFGI